MDFDDNSQLHPNWRALATIHFPLKRFVTEEGPTTSTCANDETFSITGIDGEEAQKFYHETLQNIRTDNGAMSTFKHAASADKVTEPKQKFVPFDRNKFFCYAMENNTDELEKFDLRAIDLNMCDDYGWTALMMAACEGAKDVVHMLLTAGASKTVTSKGGHVALDFAKTKEHDDIVQLLTIWDSDVQASNPNLIQTDVEKALPVEPFYCSICKRTFTETSLRAHSTSTVHQFNMKSQTPVNKLQKFNIPPQNRGLQLMVKQGWDKESGLGPTQTGRLYPVKTVIRKQRTGLGIKQEPARVTHFKPFDLRATQSNKNSNNKARNRNDIRREKRREWKRERRLRNELS